MRSFLCGWLAMENICTPTLFLGLQMSWLVVHADGLQGSFAHLLIQSHGISTSMALFSGAISLVSPELKISLMVVYKDAFL